MTAQQLAPRGRCAYGTCAAEIQGYRLFCWPHWRRIPIALRDRLARLHSARYRDIEDGRVPDVAPRLLAEACEAIDASYRQVAPRNARVS